MPSKALARARCRQAPPRLRACARFAPQCFVGGDFQIDECQHNGTNHGDQQHGSGGLEIINIISIQNPPDSLGIGHAFGRLRQCALADQLG